MTLLNKLFSAKGGSAFGGKKTEKKKSAGEKKTLKKAKETVEAKPASIAAPKTKVSNKSVDLKSNGILLSPLATEKAASGQTLNKYIFKVAPKANKIDIKKAISKIYNVKAVSANIINVPKKTRRVGRTEGFKSGYKKAVVTLAKGQSIEIK